jgi:hypothetical protein
VDWECTRLWCTFSQASVKKKVLGENCLVDTAAPGGKERLNARNTDSQCGATRRGESIAQRPQRSQRGKLGGPLKTVLVRGGFRAGKNALQHRLPVRGFRAGVTRRGESIAQRSQRGKLGGPLKTVLVNTATSGAAKREIIDAFLLAYFARRPTVSPGKKFPSPSVTSVTSVRCLPLSRDSRTQVNDAFSSLFAASLVHPHSVTSELLNS